MTVSVRRASPAELRLVGALTAEAYLADGLLGPEDRYLDELRDAVRRADAAVLLVAVDDGHVVGTVTVARKDSAYAEVAQDDEAEIRMLAVDPTARGRGIGEALLRAAIDVGLAGGARRMALSTMPAMRAARRMYDRLGLHRAPERDWEVVGKPMLVYVTGTDG